VGGGGQDEGAGVDGQALAVAADEAEQVDLLAAAAAAAKTAGRLVRAEELLRRALALARKGDDRTQMAKVTAALGNVIDGAFRPEEAVALLDPAVTEFADLDAGVLAELKKNLGSALTTTSDAVTTGDLRRGLALFEEVPETDERRAMHPLIAATAVVKGNAIALLGRRREAVAVMTMARDLASEHGLTDIRLRALGNLVAARAELDLRAGLDSLKDAIAVARKSGHRGSLLTNVGNFGYTAFGAGDWDEALALMTPYLEEDLAPRDRLLIVNNMSVIRASRGEDVSEGLAELKRLGEQMGGNWELFLADPAANAAMAAGDFSGAAGLYMKIADDDLWQAPEYLYRTWRALMWDGAVDQARAALTRFDDVGADGPVVDARRATMKAGLAAAEGRSAEALALYREALDRWRTVHGVWDESLAGVDMVTLLDPAEPDVAGVIASTRAILQRLRAQPYLERLAAAVGAHGRQTPAPTRLSAARAEVAVTD